jgi:hypothetical protein
VVKAVVVVDEERNAANKAADATRAFMIATVNKCFGICYAPRKRLSILSSCELGCVHRP